MEKLILTLVSHIPTQHTQNPKLMLDVNVKAKA